MRLCSGSIDGAQYSIRVPANWNGKLLLYSHGYTPVRPEPHLSQPDSTGAGVDPVSRALLDRGYALAGSAYGSATGWVVAQAVRADVSLYRRFVEQVGKPVHVYVWGSSMGGLITELLAERYAWVDGAAPMCGAVGGPVRNFDNFVDSVLATQSLLGVDLTVDLFTKAGRAREGARARAVIAHAVAQPSSTDATKVLYLAKLLGLPIRGSTHPTSRSAVGTAAASLASYDAFALGAFADLVRRFGGNPADGGGSEIVDRPTVGSADRIVLARRGDVAQFRAAVSITPRIAADPAARTALRDTGNPTGEIRVPTLTMHTVYDPIVLVANESLLRQRADARGRGDLLDQLYIAPPSRTGSAPYGVGHCRFSDEQQVGLIVALDKWVRSGSRPSRNALEHEIGRGWDRRFRVPAWPTGGE